MFYNFDDGGTIKNVGVDLCDISRFEKMREAIRERMSEKILTSEELEVYHRSNFKPRTLAVYFCAKESVSKALGTGLKGIGFYDILIKKDDLGKPMVFLSGNAIKRADELGIRSLKISITHENQYVLCFTVAN